MGMMMAMMVTDLSIGKARHVIAPAHVSRRVAPEMEARDVIRLESTWKERLHTRAPCGLNDN
jgi:hypothetical protein